MGTRVAVWVLAGVLVAGMGSALVAGEAAAPAAAAKTAAPAAGAQLAKPPTAEELDKAVAVMRKVSLGDFDTDEKLKAKTEQVDAAWKALIAAGPAGASRLKQELAAIDAAKERDDYFKLGAAAVLWQIGGPAEAVAVAGIWASGVDLDLHYWYVFITALDAAQTQDERVLPMLVACLRDQKGSAFISQHYLDVPWPLTHAFLWGAYGPKGLPALDRVLDESKDETTLASAALLLARAQYLPALEKVRKLAHEGKGLARGTAVRCLGIYGHPDDFAFLVAGLKAKDPEEATDFAFALYEYEDLRAASALAPLLASEDAALRSEVICALAYLLTPEGLEALHAYAAAPKDEEDGQQAAATVAGVLKVAGLGLTWETYAAKSPDEKKATVAALVAWYAKAYVLRPDDRRLTHEELLKAAEQWKKNGRITGGDYAWVENRHVLAVATPEDIDLLLDVKARACPRVSDECLTELQTLDKLVSRLGRSRYRKVVGITEKVEPAK